MNQIVIFINHLFRIKSYKVSIINFFNSIILHLNLFFYYFLKYIRFEVLIFKIIYLVF